MHRPTWPQLALGLGLALAFAAIGQVTIRAGATLLGLASYAAAAALFVLTLRGIEAGAPPAPTDLSFIRRRAPALTLWLASAGLLIFVLLRINHPEFTADQDRFTLLAWVASVACFVAGVLWTTGWRLPGQAAVRAWIGRSLRDLSAIGLLLVLAFCLRLFQVEAHPYPFSGDEGSVGTEGRKILAGTLTNFFETSWSSQPVWSFVPTALAESAFGPTAFAVRLVSVIEGTLTVAALYLLAREVFDRAVALLAAGFLVAFPFHFQFSRLGVNNVMDALLASVVLWLTFRAVRRGGLSDYLLAGLATGFTLYTYLGSRLVLALAVGLLGYVVLTQRDYRRRSGRQLAVFGLAALVVAAPMAAFFIRHPDIFMARINQEGILQNGWLAREAANQGRSIADLLWNQFQRSTLVYITRGAPSGFFNSPLPYLNSLAAVFFVLGLAFAFWRGRQPAYLTLLVWFWAVVILGSTLTVNPPTSERLVMSIPAVALFVALGLRHTARAVQRLGLLSAPAANLLCVAVVALAGLQGALFYFGEYRTGHYFADANGEVALEASRQAAPLSQAGYRLYLLGGPRVFTGFPTFNFILPKMEKVDLNFVSPETAVTLPRDQGAFIVATPDHQADLQQLAELLPGGTWTSRLRITKPEVLYYAYQLPPAQ